MPYLDTEITLERPDNWINHFLIWAGILDGWEYEVPVEVEYNNGYYHPGKYSGPPEDCYPEESEPPEIVAVVSQLNGRDIVNELTQKQLDNLTDQCDEDQQSRYNDRDYYDDPD